MKLLGATASHVGNLRDTNQDRAFFRGATAALADGMGGHQGGERAAELAIGEFDEPSEHLSEDELVQRVIDANRNVHGHAVDHGLPGMGTTLVALTLHDDDTITIANVGDSRAYWLRGEYMTQITDDHSFVEDLVRQGRLTPEEAAIHPQRNILTRAVGIGSEVEVDRFTIEEPMIGDRFLLCSDGLFNEVSEEEILRILVETEGCHATAAALIDAALQTPARDNVTVTVVDVVGDDHPLVADLDDLDDQQDTDEIDDPERTLTDQVPVVTAGRGPRGTGGPGTATIEDADGAGGRADGAIDGGEAADGAGRAEESPRVAEAAAHQPGAATAATTTTLVRNETRLDPEVPSILEDELDHDGDQHDPEQYEDTAELEVVTGPTEVRARRPVVAALVGAVVAAVVLGGGYAAARWYADDNYFIADDGDQLIVFQGRRGGFLWFEPMELSRVELPLSELSEAEVAAIENSEFATRQSAEQLLQDLRDRQEAEDAGAAGTGNELDSIDGADPSTGGGSTGGAADVVEEIEPADRQGSTATTGG